MGCYVNPRTQSKEAFLAEHGEHLPQGMVNFNELFAEGKLPVCLVNNGPFTAAGVAFSPEELRVFASPDGRPKAWFAVPIDRLLEASDLKHYL